MGAVIKAVLFDQDGLMFDTERVSAAAWGKVAPDYGIEIGEDFLSTIRGGSIQECKTAFEARYGTLIDFDELRDKKQELFRQELRTNGLPVKRGLKELLLYLKTRGCRTALATASSLEWSLDNLREAGVEEYFDVFVCGDMVTHCKPNPEIFLNAAGQLGEQPENCLVLEDSINGIEAARRGGFPAIMVPDMTQPDRDTLAKLTACCGSLLDVIELFEQNKLRFK